jgi:hypothetical protein
MNDHSMKVEIQKATQMHNAGSVETPISDQEVEKDGCGAFDVFSGPMNKATLVC